MKKKYVFMTGKYMPSPGATGVCIHVLAKYLAGQGEEVTTICYEDNSGEKCVDGVELCRIKAPSYFFDKHYQNKFEQIRDVWTSRLMKLININKYPLRSTKLLNRYRNKCLELVKDIEQKDVIIIASYTPLEAVASLIEIKKVLPKAKIIYYSADTLSNEQGNSGFLSSEKREYMGYKWEKGIFDVCDLIFIMECHKEHYLKKEYEKYRKKMKLVNFPLLDLQKQEIFETTKTMVYAGTLLRELRNPKFACDTLLEVLQDVDYEVIFMGSGDCDDIINNAVSTSNGKLRFLGMQTHEVASKYIASAGVLLSIGNAESPMAPSKIYEYMATGKPIIHFYTWDKDPCLEPLNKYGNAITIKEGDVEITSKVVDFIRNTKQLSYYEVKKCFNTATPEYSVNLIHNMNS